MYYLQIKHTHSEEALQNKTSSKELWEGQTKRYIDRYRDIWHSIYCQTHSFINCCSSYSIGSSLHHSDSCSVLLQCDFCFKRFLYNSTLRRQNTFGLYSVQFFKKRALWMKALDERLWSQYLWILRGHSRRHSAEGLLWERTYICSENKSQKCSEITSSSLSLYYCNVNPI